MDQVHRRHHLDLLQGRRLVPQGDEAGHRPAQLDLAPVVDEDQLAAVDGVVRVLHGVHAGHLRQRRVGGAAGNGRSGQHAGDPGGVVSRVIGGAANLDVGGGEVDDPFIVAGGTGQH